MTGIFAEAGAWNRLASHMDISVQLSKWYELLLPMGCSENAPQGLALRGIFSKTNMKQMWYKHAIKHVA